MKSFAGVIVSIVAVGFAVLMPALAQGALVSYWPFDTDASDAVGPNHGTPVGGASVAGGVLVLDGIDDYVDCGSDSSLELGANDFTVVTKVQTTTADRSVLFSRGTPAEPWNQYVIALNTPGAAAAPTRITLDAGATAVFVGSETAVTDGDWHHVAMTVKDLGQASGLATLYIDGVNVAATDISALPAIFTDGPFVMGMEDGGIWGFDNFLNGSLDDMAVWNEALPPSWIAGLADGTYTPLTVPEPASVVMLGLASLLLAYAWRKRPSR